jgi:capsular polysaccharide biosynthesis protein/Mrp family chromosome partitioning ATPase
MDLSKILNLLYRYSWLLVLGALIAALTTYYQLGSQPTAYRATTDILVGPGLDSPSPDLNSLRIGGQLGQTYAELLNTDSFLQAVNQKLPQKMDLNELDNSITNRQSADTRVLTIIVYYPDPKQAVAIANAAAQTLLEISPSKDNLTASLRAQIVDQSDQLEQTVTEAKSRIQELETELASLKAANSNEGQTSSGPAQSRIQELEAELAALQAAKLVYPDAIRNNLQQQNMVVNQLADERSRLLQRQNLVMGELADERSRLSDAVRTLANLYQILQGTDSNQVQIIQPATEATSVDQQLWLKVASSGVAGLIFAIILVFVAGYFDDRLRFPGDLSNAAGVPLLSTIDRHTPLKGPGVERLITLARPGSNAANQYREAVAKLLFSIGESIPSTLLISSVGSKTGTDAAVTAGNLAVAFAQAGYKVVLVNAQIDNPIMTTLFKAEKKEVLADLMTTKSTEPGLLPVEQVPGIRFLPAGLSSEKSSQAMLNPTNVAAVLDHLRKEGDIVLVAGSTISRFAENLTLASQVDGVILVARRAEARGKVVKKLVENFRLMNIHLAGVIFDYNTSPLPSNGGGRISFAFGRGTSREALPPGSLSEQTTES